MNLGHGNTGRPIFRHQDGEADVTGLAHVRVVDGSLERQLRGVERVSLGENDPHLERS
jgi:hypothetical protein